ncbi:MAG: recombinase family protein [Chitinophagaceae bacterium]|nr:recombinase family protein [Chitinophagaceae bacterium]
MAQDQMQNNKKTEIQTIIAGHFSKNRGKIVRRSGNISISYNRVSSKDQMENGNSLSWQNEQMDLFALKNNYQITAQYGGTFESAKTDERKEFQRMLAEIKKDPSIANVLVYSYDRFSRSGANGIFLLENLRKLGVRIIAITQEVDSFTPTGMFQENLYMLISKLDNDMRKDKSMAGTKSILKKGYWPYGTPYGYDNLNKYATADKHEYVIKSHGLVLRQAFKWKAEGKYSNRKFWTSCGPKV